MNKSCHLSPKVLSITLAIAMVSVILTSPAAAQESQKRYLDKQMDQAIKAPPGRNGEIRVVVSAPNEGRSHPFHVRSIGDFSLKGGRLEKSGIIWHIHAGYDDMVLYSVIVEKGKKPQYKITRIEYRGIFKNGKSIDLRKIGEYATLGSKIVDPVADLLTDIEFAIRRKREGKWEVAAQVVVEAIAKRLDKEVNK